MPINIALPQSTFIPTRTRQTFNVEPPSRPAGPNPGPALTALGSTLVGVAEQIQQNQRRSALADQEKIIVDLDAELTQDFHTARRKGNFDAETFNRHAEKKIVGTLKKVPDNVYKDVIGQYARVRTNNITRSEGEHTRRLREEGWANSVSAANDAVAAFEARVSDMIFSGTGAFDFTEVQAEGNEILKGIRFTAINAARGKEYKSRVRANMDKFLRAMRNANEADQLIYARAAATEAETDFMRESAEYFERQITAGDPLDREDLWEAAETHIGMVQVSTDNAPERDLIAANLRRHFAGVINQTLERGASHDEALADLNWEANKTFVHETKEDLHEDIRIGRVESMAEINRIEAEAKARVDASLSPIDALKLGREIHTMGVKSREQLDGVREELDAEILELATNIFDTRLHQTVLAIEERVAKGEFATEEELDTAMQPEFDSTINLHSSLRYDARQYLDRVRARGRATIREQERSRQEEKLRLTVAEADFKSGQELETIQRLVDNEEVNHPLMVYFVYETALLKLPEGLPPDEHAKLVEEIEAQRTDNIKEVNARIGKDRWTLSEAAAQRLETAFTESLAQGVEQQLAKLRNDPANSEVDVTPFREGLTELVANAGDMENFPVETRKLQAEINARLVPKLTALEQAARNKATQIRQGFATYNVRNRIATVDDSLNKGYITDVEQLAFHYDEMLTVVDELIPGEAGLLVKQEIYKSRVKHEDQIAVNKIDANFKPTIEQWKKDLAEQAPNLDGPATIKWVNARIRDYLADTDLQLHEEKKFERYARSEMLNSELTAIEDDFTTMTLRGEAALETMFSEQNRIYEEQRNNEDFNLEEHNETTMQNVEETLEQFPLEIQDRLAVGAAITGLNATANKQNEDAVIEQQGIDKEKVKFTEERLLGDIDQGNLNITEAARQLDTIIEGTSLPLEDKIQLRQETMRKFSSTKLSAEVRDFLSNTQNLEDPNKLNTLRESIKEDARFTNLPDIDHEFRQAVVTHTSHIKSLSAIHTDEAISAIPEATFDSRKAFNDRTDITRADKEKYNTRFNEHYEKELSATRAQINMDGNAHAFGPKDTQELLDWWELTGASQALVTNEAFRTSEFPRRLARVVNMPKPIMDEVWSVVESADTSVAESVLVSLSIAEGMNRQAVVNSLNTDQLFAFTAWKHLSNSDALPSGQSAIEHIRALNADPVQREIYRKRQDQFITDAAQDDRYFNPEEIRDELNLEDVRADSVGLAFAQRDFVNHVAALVGTGMREGRARDAAKDLIRKEWGNNLDGEIMFLPPSVTAGSKMLFDPKAGEFNFSWVEGDIREAAKGVFEIPEDKNITLFADGVAFAQYQRGKPVTYLIQWYDDEGMIEYATDDNGEYIRYEIDPSEELLQQQAIDINNRSSTQPRTRTNIIRGPNAPTL